MKNLTPLRVCRDNQGKPVRAVIYERGNGTALIFELQHSEPMLANARDVETQLVEAGIIVPDGKESGE